MAEVWKYAWSNEQLGQMRARFEIPVGAEPLHIGYQGNTVAMWFRVDPNAKPVTRQFVLAETGKECPDEADGRHLGSLLLLGGSYVLHVFMRDTNDR